MEPLIIDATEDTPALCLDAVQGLFELSGRSLPEDVSGIYSQAIQWIQSYSLMPNPETVFTFKLVYFNTASSKSILDILLFLEKMAKKGHNVVIKWYYVEDDEDMLEAGREYSGIVDVKFELIPVNSY